MSAPLSPTISACSSDSPNISVTYPSGPPSTRRRLAPSQTSALLSVFEVKTHPSREERALLAAELGMELKAVNAWFQNKRRNLKKTWSTTGGWSKGSLPENKHVRPHDGLKTLPPSDSVVSLERVASSHELPDKAKRSSTRPTPSREAVTPKRRAPASAPSKNIWELLPSSPPTRPSSPAHSEPLLALEPCAKRLRSLEWACAKARAGRRATTRSRNVATAESSEDDSDIPMLVLDGSPRDKDSSGDDTETEEEEEVITPDVSSQLLPPFILTADSLVDGEAVAMKKKTGKGKDMDMEAAIALLGFMAPEP